MDKKQRIKVKAEVNQKKQTEIRQIRINNPKVEKNLRPIKQINCDLD